MRLLSSLLFVVGAVVALACEHQRERWESTKASHKRVFHCLPLMAPENPQLEMAKALQKPVFALPAVNRSV